MNDGREDEFQDSSCGSYRTSSPRWASPGRSQERKEPSVEMDSVADLLDKWLKKNKVKQRVDPASLFGRWRDVVGEKVARRTRVVDVRSGELIVEVSSSALLNELSTYYRQEILDSLRGVEAFRSVKRIRFRLGPAGRSDPMLEAEERRSKSVNER